VRWLHRGERSLAVAALDGRQDDPVVIDPSLVVMHAPNRDERNARQNRLQHFERHRIVREAWEHVGNDAVQRSFTSRERWSPLTEVIMRIAGFVFGIALAGFASAASAMPAAPVPMPIKPIVVQLQCSPQRCIDPRTGVYTESTCDRYGCRQSSGPVGRVGGGRGRGYDGDDDDAYEPRMRRREYGSGGGMDCNRSRCIDGSGRVWESTCDRGGCRPLRPARGQRW
jgi:hypothetical protein